MKTVVVAGALAQKAGSGGHVWALLQFALGLRRLGFEVIFIDAIEPTAGQSGSRLARPWTEAPLVMHAFEATNQFAAGISYSALVNNTGDTFGLSREELLSRVARSAFFFNINGFLVDKEVLAAAGLRVLVDIDPGFNQMWRSLGLADPLQGHDLHVTFGRNIGRVDCSIPTCGLDWITIAPPVVLGRWPVVEDVGIDRFTSVATWRGAYAPVQFGGTTYGLRVHEFRRFAQLPGRVGLPFELALDIHPAETRDLALLAENGWSLVDPGTVAGSPGAYQRYIQSSKAEFSVAKAMYVKSNSGWFSDRSACYLASGKPVLAQDTGFSRHYPTGEGLLAFNTPEEAAAGAAEIWGNYPRHARAAREIAEAYFDSDKVLGGLLAAIEAA